MLPAAVPGIATGSILALSRAIGEAAPLLLLGALAYISFNPDGVLSQFTVLPVQIYDFIKQSREEFVPLASAAIVVLLVILLAMNSVAIFLRNKFQRAMVTSLTQNAESRFPALSRARGPGGRLDRSPAPRRRATEAAPRYRARSSR